MARKSRKGAGLQAPHKTGMKMWKAALYIRLSVKKARMFFSLKRERFTRFCIILNKADILNLFGLKAGEEKENTTI